MSRLISSNQTLAQSIWKRIQQTFWGGTRIALCFSLAGCLSSKPTIQQQVEEVAYYLTGVMETSLPPTPDSESPTVRIVTCKVEVPGENQVTEPSPMIFLYQEQALTDDLAAPYRQRFLVLSPSQDGNQVEAATYIPTKPAAWVNFCGQPEDLRIVQRQSLGNYRCSVFLEQAETEYVGQTQVGGCPANYRGAVRVTNQIILRSEGMETLDRGFDQAGNQVWGAENAPYRYRRIDLR
ncbi:MAG: chromophore lyase CpcT/CpeT [Microcoleaceae cyanobacterium]